MPELKKAMLETFARGLSQGLPRAEAYRLANPKAKHPAQAAFKLFKKKEIQDRVRELLPIAESNRAITAVINKEWVIAELLRLAKVAEKDGDLSTARGCVKDVGDAIGVFDKGGKIKFDWNGDPAQLSDSQLETLQFYLERLGAGEEKARELQMKRLGLSGVTIEVTPTPSRNEQVLTNQEPEW